ncbi:MAG TPA: hypothetical protein PL089_14915 [Ignavibacteria bacterium]|nr:hypothetical protein [Ignavibacteriaceae bacterium]HRK00900.1 hypothetical protein [Ignavibacteria bacterium]
MNLNKKEFLRRYIVSLKERTRNEKNNKVNYGFDWIIYQLRIGNDETPYNLPFLRSENQENFKTKTEAQFGIDLAFLNKEKTILTIFVLKDEPLQYKNWITNNFESDLRRATNPDLQGLKLHEVKIVLAYNKDEDAAGLKSFENFTNSCNTTIHDQVSLSFERWNLDRIVEEVESNLLTPELMPQDLSSILSYMCSQLSDFEYMSEEWQKQLVPNWKRFLNTILQNDIDETKINLIPIALIIMSKYKKDSPDSEIGWIDLTEWAALYLWDKYRNLKTLNQKQSVMNFWKIFYLAQLEDYNLKNKLLFEIENGIQTDRSKLGHLSAINDSLLAYDFIGKFGIMTLGISELINNEEKDTRDLFIQDKAIELNNFITLNPSTLRPLLDIHHIQIFLIWLIFYFSRFENIIENWLLNLLNYLTSRRIGNMVPFIEGGNRLDLVCEFTGTGVRPDEYIDDSSYLLMMILEICFGLKSDNKKLTELFFKHIVLGYGDNNELLIKEEKSINLQSWVPPDNWDEKIFLNKATQEGIVVDISDFWIRLDNLEELDNRILDSIQKSINKFPNKIDNDIPLSVYILGCLKNQSPLPPFFWRHLKFKELH